MRKAVLILLAAFLLSLGAKAQEPEIKYVSATEFEIIGKLFPDTPNPYHRVDTVRFKGFTSSENKQVRQSSGLAVVFRTDSPIIRLKATTGKMDHPSNTMSIAARGFDLYIRKDGKWLWAAAGGAMSEDKQDEPYTIINHLDGSMHECLLYLPLMSELYTLDIGVAEDATIEAIPNPFRHRVALFGSSFTHGVSCSRCGMTYPAQFTRNTGIQILSLGCSGNCWLQDYFADVLAAADADAFLFDAFSNPSRKAMRERLFPFIEKIQAAHPGKPLIFQRTIYRERRNFNVSEDEREADRMRLADSLMNVACKRYKDVYYIKTTSATAKNHEATVDGVHPDSYGYTLWEQSIEKKVLRILRKYGIR